MSLLDTAVVALVVFGPFLAGGIAGALLGRKLTNFVTALGLGVLLTGTGLLALAYSSENHQWAACGEDACTRFVGRWATTDLFTLWLPFTFVTWTAGAFAGWRLRQPSTPAP